MIDILKLFSRYSKIDAITKCDIINIICMSVCIRNFNNISDKMKLPDIAKLMEQYYSITASSALSYNGDIDRFFNNIIVIFFRVVDQAMEDPSLSCGKDIINKLKGFADLDIGVGICKGEIIYGEFGSKKRATVTGFGDPINCAIELAQNNSGLNKK